MAIRAKIQKLFNLAERAGTEAEALAAMNAAQILLAKYNLTSADIEAVAEGQETVQADDSTPMPLRNSIWQSSIYSGIAQLYFCAVYRKRKQGLWFYCVVGKPSNIAVVHYVARCVINTGKELADKEARIAAQRCADDGVELNTRPWKASFLLGFAARVRERALAQIREAKANTIKDQTGTALVLAPAYNTAEKEVAAFMRDAGTKLRHSTQRTTATSRSGFDAGRDAGNNANLAANGIAQNNTARLLA